MQTKAQAYLQQLCLDIPTRTVGSAGNRQATDFFRKIMRALGFDVETPQFDCIDWRADGARLAVGDTTYKVFPSPYTLGGQWQAPLETATTIEELTRLEARGKIILLHGELTKGQLVPKNYVFFNVEEHQRIIALLEENQPAAIIAATDSDPGLAGGISPFPLIEDGDFDIPSVYMTAEKGQSLLAYLGETVELEIRAQRTAATGCNVLARKGNPQGVRLVFMAHIDAKTNSPGAVDNGAGIVILLLLAELLKTYAGPFDIEITAVNGEDYYAASGEMLYLAQQGAEFEKIALAINIDAAGYFDGKTAYSLYDCPSEIANTIRHIFAGHAELIEGEKWYQSDHSMFIQHQVPAMAITSEKFWHLTSHITHTPKDHPNIIDPAKLVATAQALYELVLALEKHTTDN
ncbi:MAG: M28 family peptidase [Anaerolineae bacterium]|nr:M28 family peptidase [Anaerolineae bacterium]